MPDTHAANQSSTAKPSAAQTLFATWLAENIRPGERYCGVVLNTDGSASHHLFLLAGDKGELTWSAACDWAKEIGGALPSRAEQSILFGNAKGEFKRDWYWSSEQHASLGVFAWGQFFDGGLQRLCLKSAELRARAVRRLAI